jgi:hypothetical protein
MRQTESLPTPRFSLVRWVFAGCHQSLLGNGPSRHYLRNPCIGARTLTPQRPFGAPARFFPKDFSLTLVARDSTRQLSVVMQLQRRGIFRGCSHSIMFKLLYLLGPQVAPTTGPLNVQGGRAVYTTHRPDGYPFRVVASLRA